MLTRGPQGPVVINGEEGGRQGDPLFPFWFSLAIRDLVDELGLKFAKTVTTLDEDGNSCDKRLIWAYLDDICLILKEGKSYQQVLEFLESSDVSQKYGLAVNPAKCECYDVAHMRTVGCGLLGSWIGGPDDSTSKGSILTQEAADILKTRVSLITDRHHGLSIAEAFILLKWCWFPSMNYLLRTLPPLVGVEGVQLFDQTIASAYSALIRNDSSVWQDSSTILNLPLRLHGAGLFNQSQLKPFASAASYIQARGYLRSLGLNTSLSMDTFMQQFVNQCASNLNLPVEELFEEDFWKEKHLQRRVMEVERERQWLEIFCKLPNDADRIRFLEGSGPLARAVLQIPMTYGPFRLDDDVMRYKLRDLVGSKFLDASHPVTGCPKCIKRYPDVDLHFLSCDSNQGRRTFRHTSIKRVIAQAVCSTHATYSTGREEVVGINNATHEEVRADFVATIDGTRSSFDVGVTAMHYSQSVQWPTKKEVQDALKLDEERGPSAKPPLFFWEDHSDETAHPDTIEIRKFRQMAMAKVISGSTHRMLKEKRSQYRHCGGVIPLVFTAGGGLTADVRDFIDTLSIQNQPNHSGKRNQFRKDLLANISASLLRASAYMYVSHVRLGLAAEERMNSDNL